MPAFIEGKINPWYAWRVKVGTRLEGRLPPDPIEREIRGKEILRQVLSELPAPDGNVYDVDTINKLAELDFLLRAMA